MCIRDRRYFSPASKKEIEDLASIIIKTFENRIDNLDWLGAETKEVAKEKLEAISIRIGYPDYLVAVSYTHLDVYKRQVQK